MENMTLKECGTTLSLSSIQTLATLTSLGFLDQMRWGVISMVWLHPIPVCLLSPGNEVCIAAVSRAYTRIHYFIQSS